MRYNGITLQTTRSVALIVILTYITRQLALGQIYRNDSSGMNYLNCNRARLAITNAGDVLHSISAVVNSLSSRNYRVGSVLHRFVEGRAWTIEIKTKLNKRS